MTATQRTHDIFITHAWRYHDDWNRMGEALNAASGFRWRNFSVPWYDPALDPNTKVGGRLVDEWLESQIIPADVVFLLDSVYAVKSARKWLVKELEIARARGKPVLAVPNFGAVGVSAEVAGLADMILSWSPEVLVWGVKNACVWAKAA